MKQTTFIKTCSIEALGDDKIIKMIFTDWIIYLLPANAKAPTLFIDQR